MRERYQLIKKMKHTKKGSSATKAQDTKIFPSTRSDADRILSLQKSVGNHAVQRLPESRRLRGKLQIGEADDIYEQEAGRVAEQAMRMTEPQAQRQEKKEVESHMMKPLLQRQPDDSFQASHSLEKRLAKRQGRGRPLPVEVRSFMEPLFGVNLSGVRIHTDSEAVQMNRELNAKAFTNNRDIYFGTGRYDPRNTTGKRLLAHELTHVMQQNNGSLSAQVIQLDPLDDIRRALHRMPPPTTREATREERQAVWERRESLRQAFRSVDPLEAESLYNRLFARREGDELSMLFHDMLAGPTRDELLAILRRRFPTRIEMEEEEIEASRPDSLDDILRRVHPNLRSMSGEPAARMTCCVGKMLTQPNFNDEYLTRNLVLRLYQNPASPSDLSLHLRRNLERYAHTVRTRPLRERTRLITDWLITEDARIYEGLHEVESMYGRGEARFLAEWIRQRQADPNSLYSCYGAPR